jgi:Glyoxalase-like domain
VTRLACVVLDARDYRALALWWSRALGWRLVDDDPHGVYAAVEPPDGEQPIRLVFQATGEEQRGRDRVHLDLRSLSHQDQEDLVSVLEELGARRVDIGQGDVPWVVLADPEGHEFCVLEPRPEYSEGGQLAAIVVQAVEPAALERFWSDAVRPQPPSGPQLEFVQAPGPHERKNQVHLDVRPEPGESREAEVERLTRLGARRADVGQGDEKRWVVLADPEGNEFCVLAPG